MTPTPEEIAAYFRRVVIREDEERILASKITAYGDSRVAECEKRLAACVKHGNEMARHLQSFYKDHLYPCSLKGCLICDWNRLLATPAPDYISRQEAEKMVEEERERCLKLVKGMHLKCGYENEGYRVAEAILRGERTGQVRPPT